MKPKGRILCAQIDAMTKHSLILIIIFLITDLALGQGQFYEEKRDSLLELTAKPQEDTTLIRLYAELSSISKYTDPQIAINFARKSLAISQEVDSQEGIATAYGDLFSGHFFKGSNLDSLRRYAQLLEDQRLLMGDSIGMIESYWASAMYYGNVGQPVKEIEAYQNALRLVRAYQPSEQQEAKLLTNIGGVFFSQYRADKALEYFNESLTMEQPPINRGYALANIGNVYHVLLDSIEKAQPFYDEALAIFDQENDLGAKAQLLTAKGSYFDTLNRFETAYEYHAEALKITLEHQVDYSLPEVYQGLTSHYRKRNDFKKSIEFGEKALKELEKQGNYYQSETIFKSLSKAYLGNGNYKRAWEVGQELKVVQDSISNIELRNRVEELNSSFTLQQKEIENELLKKTVQNSNITAIALVLGLILVGSWGISVYRSNKRKQVYNEELEAKVQERTEEVQKANAELERNNEELRTFNYIASHDLKEPIRGIGNYIQLIERKVPEDLKAETNSYFDYVNNSTARLYTLLEDISQYSRLSNLQDVAKESINLNELVQQIEVENAETIQKYGGKIIYQELPIISSSHSLVFTIFKNLIENGLKFNQSEIPTVKIDHQLTGNHHEFTFSDNGIGIDPDYFDKIFVMFKRLQNRQEYEGTGIGLAIVKLLTSKIGGQIEVKSKPQQGSQFTIKLPV
jgi:signal transduction histidine kinase/Tfp pilus assembly protein PilF